VSTAFSIIRDDPHYRRNAFHAGLRAAGFSLTEGVRGTPRPGDVFVCWNRYSLRDQQARMFEQHGAAVIVAENGYIGHSADDLRKPFAANAQQLYAISLWHHNGAGLWEVGAPGRWRDQGIEIKPWRKDGDHVLVVPQRGIGPVGVAMPDGWAKRAVARLKERTGRRVVLKDHPGNGPTIDPLQRYLKDAWCVVTWGSGAGIHAICAGIPVFSDFSRWIGASAALPLSADLEQPLMDDQAREAMLDRLAWAQFTTSEIIKGEPFRRLMAIYHAGRAKAA
jgi:hypothetical protein